ncbi:glycosyltransferase, partial [bacterium]|nr:glycosyltransferase [bacterium]
MKNIADEIIVVDTGSKDKTKEIAETLGASVIETKWNDDFSAVRNIALKEAHGDYIFILDSDEFVDVRDQLELAFLIKTIPPNYDVAFMVKIERDKSSLSLSDRLLNELLKQEPIDYQVRLFPRRDGIFFTNAAFESVDCTLRQENVKVADSQLFKITHRKDNEKLRNERKLAAVKKSFSSTDNSSMALQGGLFFLKMEDLEHAYKWFENAGKEDPVLIARIAALYVHENFYDHAELIIKRALNHFPDSPDLHLALAKAYFKKEQYVEVSDVLSKWINDDCNNMDHEYAADTFYYYGIAFLEMGNIAEGIEHIACAIEREPLNMRYQVGGLYAL